jgi:endonuclease YncB( thermonuclease family)
MSKKENTKKCKSEFKALKYNANLDKLMSCCKKTPKFNLENCLKICKIVDVYDGDTVRGVFEHNGVYNKWTIRMYGYDSPEMRPSRKLENRLEIKKNAIISRDFLKTLVLDKIVGLECLSFDKYGRVLANIYIDSIDESINDYMITNGYGYAYFGGTKK